MATQYINDADIELSATNVILSSTVQPGAGGTGVLVPDGLVVGRDGYVGAHGTNNAITTNNSFHEVLIQGTVFSAAADAISFDIPLPGFAAPSDNRIIVTQSGAVLSSARAIFLAGGNSEITVNGIVSGGSSAGAAIDTGAGNRIMIGQTGTVTGESGGIIAGGGSQITNAGIIDGVSYGVLGRVPIDANGSTQSDINVTNTGTIATSGALAIDLSISTESAVVNSGSINGKFGAIVLSSDSVLDNSGVVSATQLDAVVVGSGTQVRNTGEITGGQNGTDPNSAAVRAEDAKDVRILNEGTMTSRGDTIVLDSPDQVGVNKLVNSGTISSSDEDGVRIELGTGRIVNTGLIEGDSAVELQLFINPLAGGANIFNSGTLAGTADEAIRYDATIAQTTGQSVTVYNTGTIIGQGFNNIDRDIGTGRDAIDLIVGTSKVVNSGEIIGNVRFGAGDDEYYGTRGVVDGYVDAGSGDDRLLGGAGDDILRGGLGDDYLRASGGTDVLDGGRGSTFTSGSDTASFITVSQAVDVDLLAGTTGGGAAGTTLIDIENLEGTSGGDKLFANDEDNVLTGFAGRDTLFGANGDDVLIGGVGDDTLFGGQDDDVLRGGLGADTLNGGAGSDTADFSDRGAGVAVVLGGANNSGDTLVSIENLIGTRSKDSLGGDANANVLDGGSGNDTLFSGGGTDRLIGGRGNDLLFGGGGADTFVMEDVGSFLSGNTDTIRDFQNGIDRIDVTDFGFTDGAGANDVTGQSSSFTQVNNDVRLVLNSGDTLVIENTTLAQITDADFII